MPLITHLLFAGFTPRRSIGIDGSILAQASSVNQYSFAISGPPCNRELESRLIEPTQELIPPALDTDRCPFGGPDGANAIGVVGKPIPCLGAGVQDFVVVVPNPG